MGAEDGKGMAVWGGNEERRRRAGGTAHRVSRGRDETSGDEKIRSIKDTKVRKSNTVTSWQNTCILVEKSD